MNQNKNQQISTSLKKYHHKKRTRADRKKELKVIIWILLAIGLIGFYTQHRVIEPVEAQAPYSRENNTFPVSTDKNLTMMEWVKIETEKAGLKWNEVYCLIKNESGWNEYASNINRNGTNDYGLFQINSIHKKTISLQDRGDYKIATKWAIEKRLHDGNWNAWYGYNKCK